MPFNTDQPSYINFRDILKERTDNVIAWVGSGLSSAANLPSWTGLRSRVCRDIQSSIATLEDEGYQKKRALKDISVAEKHEQLWVSFDILSKIAPTTYKSSIRQALSPADKCKIPKIYLNLWQLGISGLINLNLDRLASRAYQKIHPSSVLNEFSGYQAGNYLHLLSSSKPFIANIHGIYEDSSSWVFTKPEIDKLLAQPTYLEFIKAILIARTVLFVGLSADDVAVGGHLEFINRLNIDIGVHFWITNRSDVATNQWAEKNGVRIIRYNVKKGKHTQLEECFQDLLHFIPQDDPDTDPVIYDVLDKPSEKISPPEILITQDTETIRNALNSEAKNIGLVSKLVASCDPLGLQ